MNRGRATRSAVNTPKKGNFVAGGILTDFTGTATANVPFGAPSNNIAVKIDPLPVSQVDNGGGGEERLLQQLADESQDVVELENIGDSTTSLNIDEGSVEPKRRWIRKPLNKRVKRLKQNRRLRKLLIPKNALMSLHELMGCQLSDYRIIPEERGFVAQISVNNIQYEGHGLSKISAKNDASEKALRDLVIQKMVQVPKAKLNLNAGAVGEGNEDVDMNEEETEAKDESISEVPMMHLASFALHKLFTEWQSEGFEIPDFKMGSHGTQAEAGEAEVPASTPTPTIKTVVPENANSLHPTTLLCMMRPGTKYVDLGTEGKSPNISHSVGVDVDGQHFIGRAKNKKLARKLAARDACNALFGTQYPSDEVDGQQQTMVH